MREFTRKVNLLRDLDALSFRVLAEESGGQSEATQLLEIVCDLLQVESAGLFIWDEGLSTCYPLGTFGPDSQRLTKVVDSVSGTLWFCHGQPRTENESLLLPLHANEQRVGLLATSAVEVEPDCLNRLAESVANFVFCVDFARNQRALRKKSDDLNRVKNALENSLSVNLSIQEKFENLAIDLQAVAAEAERANNAKSEFLTSMSHELRTPLNAVLGFSQLLAQRSDEYQDPILDQSVDHIINAGRHLLGMIESLLNLTAIENGIADLRMERVMARSVLRDALSQIRDVAAERRVTLVDQGAAELPIKVDRERLRQVLFNLLSNAIKYNRLGGRVFYGAQSIGANRLRIYVQDTGTGIEEEDQSGLFRQFSRGRNATAAGDGTGIGLYHAKILTEAMHGSIGFNSEPGVGSTFYLDFPVDAA